MRQFKPGQLQSGSLYPITASNAVTASYAINALSASYAISASYEINYETSSSYAETASYVTPLHQNVIITGSIYIPDNAHSIYFSGSNAASRLVWNDTDGTLDLGLKGGNVTLQLGQEQVVRVVNKTGANLLESQYKVARIRRVDEGGAQGQRLAIVLAQANNDANSVDTLGIVTENINVNEEGFITNSGLVRGINTTGTLQGETWTDGDVLYLSPTTPGALTTTKPQAPNHTIIMGYVVYAHNNQGKIFVKVDNGYEIDELHNVRITTASLVAGQLLVRSGSNATGIWINSNQLTGSYSLTGSLNANSITGSFTGSFKGDGSQLTGIVSSKWTGSNPISRQSDVEITGSLRVQGSITGSLFGTSSWANNAVSASFSTSASIATSASYAQTSSIAQSASFASTATTASHALEANTILPLGGNKQAGFITYVNSTGSMQYVKGHHTLNIDIPIGGATSTVYLTGSLIATSITSSLQGSASFARNATSASYALTASYLDNYIPPFPFTGSAQITGSLGLTGSLSNGVPSNQANGQFSHAEGHGTQANGYASHAEGRSTTTLGSYSHAEGSGATTYGDYSHAEGNNTSAIAAYSHAEGESTYAGHQAWYAYIAAGKIVFPSYYGDLTGIAPPGSQLLVDDNVQQSVLIHEVASIIYSGSGETEITLVDSTYDPQVGLYVGLVGNPFLTYGDYTIGSVSHAEGQSTTTLGSYSHADGNSTTAHGYYQTVVGQYNAPIQVSSSFVIGNGDSGTPSNLLVAYGNTVQVTGSIGIHNAVSATLTSLTSSFGTTPTSTYSIPVQPNGGAWFEYVIRSGSNARTGTIMAVWDDTLVNFTDTTTTDLGDTSGVTLAVINDTSNITFDASATTDDWSIKAIIRSI